MNENKTMAAMLEEQCRETLEALSHATYQSQEAAWQLRKLAQLNELRMNERKFEMDEAYREREAYMKERQIENEKKDRAISNVLTGAGIILPLGASCYWMAKGMQFEETGSFTSRVGQWVSSHLRLFRK